MWVILDLLPELVNYITRIIEIKLSMVAGELDPAAPTLRVKSREDRE